ncbi:MAG: long-chain fatty acid--CoA ligase [Candidatus Aureabacteria bacterium]|nr:long-chain fatty acid--CoA ligase [Candidatus Auribacterota bacterium]
MNTGIETLIDIPRRNAGGLISGTAYRFGKRKYTYKKLDRLSDEFASGLADKVGLSKGDRIALITANCPEYVISFFGILKTAACIVPLNNFLVADEIRYILSDSKAKAVITDIKYYDVVKKAIMQMDSKPAIIVIGKGSKEDRDINYRSLFKRGPFEEKKVTPDDAAVIIYTSGTTGFPKGAILSHYNLVSNVKDCLEVLHVKKSDRFVIILPLFHSFTITVCMLTPLFAGASFALLESVRPFHRVIRAIILGRVTGFVGIPQIFHLLSEKRVPWLIRKILKIRFCISGSAPLSEEVLKNFEKNTGLPLMEGYGLSEASPVVSVNPLRGIRKIGSVGLPLKNVSIKIVDDDEKELPAGEIGEIIVKGPNVMKGYLNLKDETAKAVRGGWLFTGDIGKVDEDGYLYIIDRKKDMILSHGLNVYPREIEQVLYQHPSIRDAAVVGVKDKHRGEKAVAFVTLKEGYQAKSRDLTAFCKGKLAPYKIPHTVRIEKELPRTPTGKILKKDIRSLMEK